ncbi:hypothetical protein [Palleronia pelagia]|uniref:hypothetical protein n=1 Tax=Palleronia pelagia TaxID=387096 RepID=UPI00111441CA|nr:hypothetical protein [Palleronia pelagia]
MSTEDAKPDIFSAAHNNDVEHLRRALADGQLLSEQRVNMDLSTPVHIAAARHSNDFLREASQHESFDPLIRNASGHAPIDHAVASGNTEGQELLEGYDKELPAGCERSGSPILPLQEFDI